MEKTKKAFQDLMIPASITAPMKILVIGSAGAGKGIVAIVSADKADAVLKFNRAQKHNAWLIGEVVNGKGEARVV